MSSSVFYKFKNSREPERIVFDGTGISVFELKREIITASGLGDGTDFDLHLYPEDQPTVEYEDDTTIISRSSTVIAVRRPAARGHGRAARYVSGRAPVRAIKKTEAPKTTVPAPTTGGAKSEQDLEAAFLAESAQVWDQQKESLAQAKPVLHHKKKPANVPAHDPPPGYVCYRCSNKGHWIQACPTNDDPNYKSLRTKRTTGIPRSFLKSIEKPADGELEDARGVRLNADGEYVQVLTDTRTWEKFQEKANASKAKAATVEAANQELREHGLECPIDKRMFVDPVKTPCCGKTYCHDCIENALADGDLVCPNCAQDGVLIDDLTVDEETKEKIRTYQADKAKEKLGKDQQAKEETKAASSPSSLSDNDDKVSVPASADEKAKASETNHAGSSHVQSSSTVQSVSDVKSPLTVEEKTPGTNSTPVTGGNGSDTDTSTTSKKRKAAPAEIKAPTAPKAMRLQKEQQARQQQDQSSALEKDFLESMEALKNMPNNMPLIPPTPMSMGMPAAPMMGMMNPANMQGINNMNAMSGMNGMHGMHAMNGMNAIGNVNGYMAGNWNGYSNGFPNQNTYGNMGYTNNANGGYGNMPYSNMNGQQGNMGGYNGGWNNQSYGADMGYTNQNQYGSFPNQQRTVFSEQPNQQDAYERKPLNPHRANNKHRKQRAPDFHYV